MVRNMSSKLAPFRPCLETWPPMSNYQTNCNLSSSWYEGVETYLDIRKYTQVYETRGMTWNGPIHAWNQSVAAYTYTPNSWLPVVLIVGSPSSQLIIALHANTSSIQARHLHPMPSYLPSPTSLPGPVLILLSRPNSPSSQQHVWKPSISSLI